MDWFLREAIRVRTGSVDPLHSFPQCGIPSRFNDFNDKETEEAFRLACQRVDAVFEKYGVLFVSDVKELSNPERLDFAGEVGLIVDILRDDLICGLGKQSFEDDNGKRRCRERGPDPL